MDDVLKVIFKKHKLPTPKKPSSKAKTKGQGRKHARP
jgi:hypothetical protein